MDLDIDRFGLPGEEHMVVVVPLVAGRPTSGPQGSPGDYVVTFFLVRPGFALSPEYNFNFTENDRRGSSHLAISAPAAHFEDSRFNTPGTRFNAALTAEGGATYSIDGLPNEEGYLCRLQLQLHARSAEDAETTASLVCLPLLGSLSVVHDIPLEVSETHVREVATDTISKRVSTPYSAVAGADIPTIQIPEARTLCESYRDALNSNNKEWRFLCFIRILEQLWKWQTALAKAGDARAVNLESTIVPSTPEKLKLWLADAFPRQRFDEQVLNDVVPADARGKTTNEVIVQVLRPIRDDIVHGLFDRGVLPPTKNDIDHERRVRAWLPMARCITRLHLRAVFKF